LFILNLFLPQQRRSFYPRDFQIYSLEGLEINANPKFMWFQRRKTAKTITVRRVYMILSFKLCEFWGTFSWLKKALNVMGGPVISTGMYKMYVKKFSKSYSATSWNYYYLSLRHSHVLEHSVHLAKCLSFAICLNCKFAQYYLQFQKWNKLINELLSFQKLFQKRDTICY